MPFHCRIDIPFDLPERWERRGIWVKGDLVYAVGFHRVDLVRLGKDRTGKRQYQVQPLPPVTLREIQRAVLHGLSLGALTKGL